MAEYRAEVIIWMLSGTMSLVMMLVWMAQAAAAPGGRIARLRRLRLRHLLPERVAGGATAGGVGGLGTGFQIRQGTLSPKLLRPSTPCGWNTPPTSPSASSASGPMLVAGMRCSRGCRARQFTRSCGRTRSRWGCASGLHLPLPVRVHAGLLAFWTESSTAFSEVAWLVYAALGGLFAPLTFYPQWVQNIAVWTPFPYMLGLPAQLLAGKATLGQAGVRRADPVRLGGPCSGSCGWASGGWAEEIRGGGGVTTAMSSARGAILMTLTPSPRPRSPHDPLSATDPHFHRGHRLGAAGVPGQLRRARSSAVWVRSGWRCWHWRAVRAGHDTVGGWTFREALLVTGFFILTEGFIAVFVQPNMSQVAEAIRTGNMDFTLLKPLDAQFSVSTRLPERAARCRTCDRPGPDRLCSLRR